MTRRGNRCEELLDDMTLGPGPALNVVVYRNPGPDDDIIAEHALKVVEANSPWGTDGRLGYVVFVESDFDRLWDGVDRGDALGTAYAVLPFLGPEGAQFIGRTSEFIFGWIGHTDPQFGRILLLQVIPRSDMDVTVN